MCAMDPSLVVEGSRDDDGKTPVDHLLAVRGGEEQACNGEQVSNDHGRVHGDSTGGQRSVRFVNRILAH